MDDVDEERPDGPGDRRQGRHRRLYPAGGFPVGGEMVLAAHPVVPHAGRARHGGVEPTQPFGQIAGFIIRRPVCHPCDSRSIDARSPANAMHDRFTGAPPRPPSVNTSQFRGSLGPVPQARRWFAMIWFPSSGCLASHSVIVWWHRPDDRKDNTLTPGQRPRVLPPRTDRTSAVGDVACGTGERRRRWRRECPVTCCLWGAFPRPQPRKRCARRPGSSGTWCSRCPMARPGRGRAG